jgi:hypothetical protein
VELVVEEEIAEEGRPGAGEAQNGHGHQLEVERPDAQEPGHRGAQQDAGCLLLLGLQIHARRLEDVTGFVGPLLRFAQPQHEKRHGETGQTEQQSIAPVVGEGYHEAEEEQADGAREGIREVVPAEDPSPAFGRVGIGQIRVVHRVVDPEPDGGDQVEEHEPPDIRGETHQGGEHGHDQQGDDGHQLAAPAVGPQRQRHRPQQLGRLRHEGDRAEAGIREMERSLQVDPDQVDAVAERARHHGGRRHQDERGELGGAQDGQQWRGFARSRARHHFDVGDGLRIATAGHDFLQEVVRDGKVEERLFVHWGALYP